MSGESRMAKILRRLAGKDEENQESKRKGKEMSEYKDARKRDLDLDLGEISGEVAKSDQADQPKTSRPFESLKRKSPVEPLKKTVDNHLEESWICFIENGKVEHRELRDCTAEEFGKWLMWVYPPANEFLEKNLRLFDSYEKREKEYLNLIAFLTKLPSVFKKYGEEKMIPRAKGKDRKSGGKDE